MEWKIKNKVINSLYFQKSDLISPWGFETADSSAFFSLEEGFGYRYELLEEDYSKTEKSYSGSLVVKMKEGLWKLTFKDEIINDNSIKRKVDLECLEDSYFMDFVLRFRIKKQFVDFARIGNKIIKHRNTNIYYQFPVSKVDLEGPDHRFGISIEKSEVPDKMNPFMYVRDWENDWVIHVRMLPNSSDKNVIKLCNNWFRTRPLPQFFNSLILRNKTIKENLWYRGEKSKFQSKFWRFVNPAAFPMVKLNKGTTMSWEVDFVIQEI